MIEGPERKGPRSGIRAGPKSREETPAMGTRRLAKTVPETPRVLAKAPAAVQVRVPVMTPVLEGAHRSGHFDGVASVVTRLLSQVQPDVAAFGRKDYQQLAMVRHLVRDLALPLRVLAGATLREADGLAMSSRNQFLSPDQRLRAVEIHRTLLAIRDASSAGMARDAVEAAALARLQAAGLEPDYAALRCPDLSLPDGVAGGPRVALIAARLGDTRLIDNLEFDQ